MAKINKTIREATITLEEIFQEELAKIGDKMIAEIMRRAKQLTPAQRLNAVKELKWPGESDYMRIVKEALAEIALDAIQGARKEVPKAKSVQLTETIDAIQFAIDAKDLTVLLEKLPTEMRKKIRKQADLLVGTQLQDLEKTIQFQYSDSIDSSDDLDVIRNDVQIAALEYIQGSSIRGGAGKAAAQTINDSRNAFFFDKEVLDEIAAFEFVNGDPVTEICQDLAGTVFAKDDPNMFRYTPPLHWNCKSYIQPIVQGKLGNREIEALKPSTRRIEETIQFSESKPHCSECGC